MGNYVLTSPFDELDAEEVLMLHTMPVDLTTEPSRIEALVEPIENDHPEDNQISLLDNF